MNAIRQMNTEITTNLARPPQKSLPAEVKKYLVHSYDCFVKIIDNRMMLYTEKNLRRKLKRSDSEELIIASVSLGNRYFKPNIEFRFKARWHKICDDCGCYMCNTRCLGDEYVMAVEFFVEIFTIYNGSHGCDDVFRHFELFELTSKTTKIHSCLTRRDFIKSILAFFKVYYPFNRCASCRYRYTETGDLCYKCDANAIQYNTNGDKCSICIDTDIKLVCCKLPCGHIFHKACYDKHSRTGISNIDENTRFPIKAKCPLCKAEATRYAIH